MGMVHFKIVHHLPHIWFGEVRNQTGRIIKRKKGRRETLLNSSLLKAAAKFWHGDPPALPVLKKQVIPLPPGSSGATGHHSDNTSSRHPNQQAEEDGEGPSSISSRKSLISAELLQANYLHRERQRGTYSTHTHTHGPEAQAEYQ